MHVYNIYRACSWSWSLVHPSDSHSGGVDASRPYLLHFTQEQCAVNATPKRINNNYYYCYLWKLCWATMELLREWLFPALQIHFMPTRWLCQPKLDSASPCLSLSCLSRMQLQALASCQAPPPTLCACALYACSYSAAIRAYFLPNLLHSNVRNIYFPCRGV